MCVQHVIVKLAHSLLWAITFKEESIWKISEYLKNNLSENFIIQGYDGTLKSSSMWSYDSLSYYRR